MVIIATIYSPNGAVHHTSSSHQRTKQPLQLLTIFSPTAVKTKPLQLTVKMVKATSLILALSCSQAAAFFAPPGVPGVQWGAGTRLQFGLPSGFGSKSDEPADKAEDKKPEKKISAGGLLQMIAAGAGAPFLGDFEGVDKDTGKLMFSLEANNLVDEDGRSKQTQMPYFENGWYEEEDETKPTPSGGGFKFPWQK